jgi:succinylglutamic semialdehyde dehydrogenase
MTARYMQTHYINGKWIQGKGDVFNSINPFSGEEIWQGHEATQDEVSAAVHAASESFLTWSKLSVDDRIQYLNKFAELLKTKKSELGELIAKETGKPLWESLTEASAMAGKIPISIDAFAKRNATFSKDLPGKTSITRYKPHGVVAVFGPFNFPGHLPNGHIVPALLAGNSVVFKPSEMTPLVAEFTVKLWEEAGLPSGVLNLVQGARETGEFLLQAKQIRGVFFTGSSQTGQIIHKTLLNRPEVILAMEMGGNNALVVHEVKDLAAASYLTMQSAYLTAGQRCTCARRLIVPKGSEGDAFLNTLCSKIKGIQVGGYADKPEPFMGTVIHKAAADKVIAARGALLKKGANELVQMERKGDALLTPGLIDVTEVKDRADEEVFGPLLQVIRVADLDAAIIEANATRYGLAAGIFTDKKECYEKFYSNVNAGIINWNQQLTGASSSAPFGGIGLSGNFKPSAYFAADYCSYPVASLEAGQLTMPDQLPSGLK